MVVMDEREIVLIAAEHRKTHPRHRYEALEGEALDQHMMDMHGWDMVMVARRGSKSLAHTYNYMTAWHQGVHNDASPMDE
jgi:hypothetical protein